MQFRIVRGSEVRDEGLLVVEGTPVEVANVRGCVHCDGTRHLDPVTAEELHAPLLAHVRWGRYWNVDVRICAARLGISVS
jgi:hypothetical protein